MTKEVHRMKVHVFGNRPSPLVARNSLKRVIREEAQRHGTDAIDFVEHHFYVDDGPLFVLTDSEAINLLSKT